MRVQQSISWKKYWIGQWKSLIRGTADLIIYIIMWDELKIAAGDLEAVWIKVIKVMELIMII